MAVCVVDEQVTILLSELISRMARGDRSLSRSRPRARRTPTGIRGVVSIRRSVEPDSTI